MARLGVIMPRLQVSDRVVHPEAPEDSGGFLVLEIGRAVGNMYMC